ncbi:MAG: type II secretion system GspH family protein [Epsilonproteobacteria bacterium]|nr:type II secretion system GspH family protein [Campylobacterota bacterium]
MKKSAFTIIELVFVIIVLGILASVAMSRMERDLTQEASETILSHIRLAQQLALNDNKHRSDNSPMWQRAYWQFALRRCGDDVAYRVGSDTSLGSGVNGIGDTESAINPIDGKYIFSEDCENLDTDETPSVLLTKKFGIKNSGVTTTGGCDRNQILFDYLGRPHFRNTTYTSPDFSNIMTEDCNLTFTLEDSSSFSIIIEDETGHAYIEGQESL